MFPGFLIEIIIVLVIVGLALWVLQQIPMDATIARIIRVILIVFVAIWLLYILIGLLPSGGFGYGHRLS
jgi:hypothetical protein